MEEAGYSAAEAQAIKAEVDHFEKVREEVKMATLPNSYTRCRRHQSC